MLLMFIKEMPGASVTSGVLVKICQSLAVFRLAGKFEGGQCRCPRRRRNMGLCSTAGRNLLLPRIDLGGRFPATRTGYQQLHVEESKYFFISLGSYLSFRHRTRTI